MDLTYVEEATEVVCTTHLFIFLALSALIGAGVGVILFALLN